ncbi:hypothetical protein [Petroclostridium xylanilyticum]|jgi:hypothetical protein|uniref:hypothetical protein n=1 Tax=Petroclostridium xylanilyticum TaxID=1792311 RepID=UPI000B990BB2|nr:hypothetical protein [Petroclostridium xylanilyticum]
MNRLELYRRRRRNKRLLFLAILASLAILVVGLVTVDHAVNSMLGVEDELKIVSLVKTADSIYILNFMNYPMEVNLSYLKKDFKSLSIWVDNSYKRVEKFVSGLNDCTKAVTNTQ